VTIRKAIWAAHDVISGVANQRPMLTALWLDESGQDLIEFALVAALLSLCAVATLQALATRVTGLWQSVASQVANNV
jgi:pilus assembly protein Flp/PilA